MTNFENEILVTLLRMKAMELKENPPEKGGRKEIANLAEMADELYHGLICLSAIND